MYYFAAVPVICLGGLDEGTGSASIPRYYYDSTQKKCIQFKYTGSGGNNNNFVSMKNCMGVCAKSKCGNVLVPNLKKYISD